MSSNNNNIEGQPPAKRQRRSLGASDRVVLDVGGTKFITSASTLTSNSAYFASLLSDNWIESNNNGDDEIFIDQNPSAFSILLDYMRQGSIEIDDINTKVILLAEFLGMERLLLAVKVRWYCNIGRGPVHTKDDEIVLAFDQEHGGIMKAISSGLFKYFLKQNNIDAEKEFATVSCCKEAHQDATPRLRCTLKEVGKPGQEHETAGLQGALNGLHLKGYTHYENQLKTMKETYTFSRRKHAIMSSGATDIFVPNDEEVVHQERSGYVKQFATVGTVEVENNMVMLIFAPVEFHEDESRRSDPLDQTIIRDPGPWLEDNGFLTREDAYEDIFREHIKVLEEDKAGEVKISIFSRVTSKVRDDEAW